MTLSGKLANIATQQAALVTAINDLVNPQTGEVLAPGTCVIDLADQVSYANVNGAIVRHQIVVAAPAPAITPPAPPVA